MSKLQDELAIRVRSGLEYRGWSQKRLAEVTGYSEKHVSQMLTGAVEGTLSAWQDLLAEVEKGAVTSLPDSLSAYRDRKWGEEFRRAEAATTELADLQAEFKIAEKAWADTAERERLIHTYYTDAVRAWNTIFGDPNMGLSTTLAYAIEHMRFSIERRSFDHGTTGGVAVRLTSKDWPIAVGERHE